MDLPRPDRARRRKSRRIASAALGLVALALVSLGVSRLEPAAPAVERATVWIETVTRGPMVRKVRGIGSLVPEDVRWIAAATEGRVERIVLQPGSTVAAGSVIVELANPELDLARLDAESQWRGAEARLTELRVRLESQRLDQEAATARVQAEYVQARLVAERDEALAAQGLVADLTRQLSRVTAEERGNRRDVEQKRLAIATDAMAAQIAAQRLEVEQLRALAGFRRSQVEALHVRAGIDGVLQQVPLEVGQRVTLGTNLARVAVPDRLKAALRIAEVQAKDVQVGQRAIVDTRNGVVEGHVVRVDPAVHDGTVTVDVTLDGALPPGARPDLTVDGVLELERLEDVVHVARPALGQPGQTASLFRLAGDTGVAWRATVRFGRASFDTIEIAEGLVPGDRVVVSDASAWEAHDRIRIQ